MRYLRNVIDAAYLFVGRIDETLKVVCCTIVLIHRVQIIGPVSMITASNI